MFRDIILKYFVSENWEKTIATGYEKDMSREDALKDLNNDNEEVPGDTEFPTYDQLISRRKDMEQHNRDFTQDYSKWTSHREGEK